MMPGVEVKSLADRLFRIFFQSLQLPQIKNLIQGYIDRSYSEGIESAEVEFDMTFLPDREKLDFLRNYVENTIDFHTDSIGKDLRNEISRALLDEQDVTELKKRVKGILQDKKYMNRLKTVLRTEGLRANNYGSLDGARQSGLPLRKYVDIIRDSLTSEICLSEDRKYGKKNEAIPLDKNFVVKVSGKVIEAQAPPFHPNCRTVIRFVEEVEL